MDGSAESNYKTVFYICFCTRLYLSLPYCKIQWFMENGKSSPRRVFITGGAHGIGRSIVQAFAAAGHQVAFVDKDAERGRLVAQETGTFFYQVDVADKDALEVVMHQLFQQWGDIDILVNNVGTSKFTPIVETTVEEFERIIRVNLTTAFITSRMLVLHRNSLPQPNPFGGRIINISSTRYLQSEPGTEAYSASKGGITSLTHALAASLADFRITVNCIAPGWIHVNENEHIRPLDNDFHFSKRVGCPEDIARACLFLANEENDFINGQCLVIDGGATKKMFYPE